MKLDKYRARYTQATPDFQYNDSGSYVVECIAYVIKRVRCTDRIFAKYHKSKEETK